MALNTVTFSTNEDSQVHPKFIVVYLNNTYLPQETVFGNKGILHIYILQGTRPPSHNHCFTTCRSNNTLAITTCLRNALLKRSNGSKPSCRIV